MTSAAQEERIAALLSALGAEVAEPVLDRMPSDAAERVQRFLDHFQEEPLSEEELEDVLDEFMRFFRYALQQEQTGRNEVEKPASRSAPAPVVEKKPFVRTGDVFADLEQLEPFQIAGALKDETPRTAAVVLDCLTPDKAGSALQLLPQEMRSQVFLVLRDPPKTPPQLLERMLTTAVNKGIGMDINAMADPTDEANRRLAELLRAMQQAERAQMLAALEKEDAETLTAIKQLLYTFDDLGRLANRSVQKILSEIDSQSLAMALKGADEKIADKVLANLSKRARATLVEEMDFLGNVKPNEQVGARQVICDILGRLDESGDLEMEDE